MHQNHAYDILIKGFELDQAEYEVKCSCDQYHIGSMQDARRAAYIYLKKSTGLLTGKNRATLTETAKIYKKMLDNLLEAIPYEQTTAVYNIDSSPVWNTVNRRKLAEMLKVNIVLERQVRVYMNEILNNWT